MLEWLCNRELCYEKENEKLLFSKFGFFHLTKEQLPGVAVVASRGR
jgi:hypothetical protein